ncbi:MAG: chorismate mutase [Verrucomicrobiales bacterium]|jgi:chorismate mutase
MKPKFPFYCGLIVAFVLLLASANPPLATPVPPVVVAQDAVQMIEACVRAMTSEIEAGYDSSKERERLSQEIGRLKNALGKLQVEVDREEKIPPRVLFAAAAAGSLLIGSMLSQAFVIRALKRRLVS